MNDLHEALANELLTAEYCALAIEHVAIEANPLKDPALDAILYLAVERLKDAIEKSIELHENRERIAAQRARYWERQAEKRRREQDAEATTAE